MVGWGGVRWGGDWVTWDEVNWSARVGWSAGWGGGEGGIRRDWKQRSLARQGGWGAGQDHYVVMEKMPDKEGITDCGGDAYNATTMQPPIHHMASGGTVLGMRAL